jgi:hypothetical protein
MSDYKYEFQQQKKNKQHQQEEVGMQNKVTSCATVFSGTQNSHDHLYLNRRANEEEIAYARWCARPPQMFPSPENHLHSAAGYEYYNSPAVMFRGGENAMSFFHGARNPYEPPSFRSVSTPATPDFYSPPPGYLYSHLPRVPENSMVSMTQYPPRPAFSPYWMDQQHPRLSFYY